MNGHIPIRTLFGFKPDIPGIGLLLINLIPLFFFLAGTLQAVEAFVLYLTETFSVGLFNVLRMSITVVLMRGQNKGEALAGEKGQAGFGLVLFFIAHFGLFMTGQAAIFMNAAGLSKNLSPLSVFPDVWQTLGPAGQILFWINLGILFIYGLIQFFRDREYETKSLNRMMFEPYIRIFIQQFTVILGAMLVSFRLHGTFMVLFMLAKIGFSCFLREQVFLEAVTKLQAAEERKSWKS